MAWATCDDPEPPLLAPVNWQTPLKRTAPLRPGVTPEDWRRLAGRAGFALSLARLDGDGDDDARSVGDARRLTRSAHALEGPALAALPGEAEPAVLWAERRGAGHVLLACVGGRVEVVHEARGAMIGPRATSPAGAPGAGSDVCVTWQQWPDAGSGGGTANRLRPADGRWLVDAPGRLGRGPVFLGAGAHGRAGRDGVVRLGRLGRRRLPGVRQLPRPRPGGVAGE